MDEFQATFDFLEAIHVQGGKPKITPTPGILEMLQGGAQLAVS